MNIHSIHRQTNYKACLFVYLRQTQREAGHSVTTFWTKPKFTSTSKWPQLNISQQTNIRLESAALLHGICTSLASDSLDYLNIFLYSTNFLHPDNQMMSCLTEIVLPLMHAKKKKNYLEAEAEDKLTFDNNLL